MTNALSVLAVMLMSPTYVGDRGDSPEARAALYLPVAEAIARVSGSLEDEAALVALREHETHFARYVLEGRCLDGPRDSRCDVDKKTGLPRARGPWQGWFRYCRAEGGSVLEQDARCAIQNLHSAKHRCAVRALDVTAGMFSGYKGASCLWPPAELRAITMRRILREIQKLPQTATG